MRNCLEKFITTVYFVFVCFFAISQEKYGHVTPQTAEFMKQGIFPVSLYTGKVNVSIPLYQYKDPDFEIPVTISYGSDGFQPGKHSGFVGHDWILNAGGCITREIYNLPDEMKETIIEEANYANGFLIQSRINTLSKNEVFNSNSTNVYRNEKGGVTLFNGVKFTDDYDYMPDMFSFNFNGNSGTFIIGNDGKVRVISEQLFHVDLSGVTGYNPVYRNYLSLSNSLQSQEISEIIITDLKGYRYYFGGALDAVEYNIFIETGEDGENAPSGMTRQITPSIMAWHLTKIIAPNGRVVKFQYTSPLNSLSIDENDPLWMFKKSITNVDINRINESGPVSSISTYRFRQSATKSVVLNKIIVEDINFLLEFDKSIEAKSLYYSGDDFCNKNYQLDGISASINDTLISRSQLLYDSIDNNKVWSRRFLKSVTQFDGGKYTFSYNYDGEFPSTDELILGTVDDYGYWKANNFLGMLQSVKYPTGGKSEFTYEPHNYGLRRIYRLYSNTYKHMIDTTTQATRTGGLRIKNIKNFNNDVLVEEKFFNYTTKFNNDSTLASVDENGYTIEGDSTFGYECMNFNYHQIHDFQESEKCDRRVVDFSGNIDWPLQNTQNTDTTLNSGPNRIPSLNSSSEVVKSTGILHSNWIIVGMSDGTTKFIKTTRSQLYNVAGPHIGYSQVTEISKNYLTNEKHYLVSEFSDNLLQNDVNAINTVNLAEDAIKQVFTNNHAYSSMSHKRGKLIKSSCYSSELALIYQTINTYQHVGSYDQLIIDTEISPNLEYSDYIVALFNGSNYSIARKIYIQPVGIKSSITTDFSGEGAITKTLKFDYDSLNRVVRELEYRSDNKWNFKKFRYPDNILPLTYTQSDSLALGYKLLNVRNMIGMPVETVVGILDNTTEKVYNASILLFKPVGNLPAPTQKLEIKLQYPISNYTPLQLNNSNIIFDNRMTNVASFEYNQLLRMTKITLAGELPLQYFWDSKNLYPIKEIQGDMITNYSYKPLVGMKSKTDARGVKTIYNYDDANRLKKIYIMENGTEKILQQFYYNYVNQ